MGPKLDLAPDVTPSFLLPPSVCFSHLLSSQYVERHFSREGTTQHNTVSAFGRGQGRWNEETGGQWRWGPRYTLYLRGPSPLGPSISCHHGGSKGRSWGGELNGVEPALPSPSYRGLTPCRPLRLPAVEAFLDPPCSMPRLF